MAEQMTCPTEEQLRRLVAGEIDERECADLEGHMLRCPACLELVRALEVASPLLRALRQDTGQTPIPQDEQVEALARKLGEMSSEVAKDPTELLETSPTLAPTAPIPIGKGSPGRSNRQVWLMLVLALGVGGMCFLVDDLARAPRPPRRPTPATESRRFPGHTAPVLCVAWDAAETRVLSGARDGRLLLHDMPTGQLLAELVARGAAVRSLAISADGRSGAAGTVDGQALLWDLATMRKARPIRGKHDGEVTQILFAPTARLVTAGLDRSIRLWSTASGKQVGHLSGTLGPVTCLGLASKGSAFVCGDQLGRLYRGDLENEELTLVGADHEGAVLGIALAPDGESLLSGAADRTARVRHLRGGEPVAVLPHPAPVTAVAFLGSTQRLLTACQDGRLRIWRSGKVEPTRILDGHEGPIHGVAASTDGRRLLSCGEDHTIRLQVLPADD